jgi:hypothetical protein
MLLSCSNNITILSLSSIQKKVSQNTNIMTHSRVLNLIFPFVFKGVLIFIANQRLTTSLIKYNLSSTFISFISVALISLILGMKTSSYNIRRLLFSMCSILHKNGSSLWMSSFSYFTYYFKASIVIFV